MADAPAFDPDKPFEPVGTAAPAFDPTKPFEPVTAQGSTASLEGASKALAPPSSSSKDWSDVASLAVSNAPASAAKFATDIAHPFIHPVNTAETLKNVGLGLAEKTGLKSGNEHVQYPDAVGKFFSDRYGGVDNLKKTLAEDPVGFASDLSTVLSGGSLALMRAPGAVGSIARTAGAVGSAVDPLSAVGAAAKTIGSGAAGIIGNLGTHTGGDSLRRAASAGFEGGEKARAFQENMRGTSSMEDVVDQARNAVSNLRQERGATYREGMKGVAADPSVLGFDKIDDALSKVDKIKNFKGQSISPKTEAIRQEVGNAVRDWKALDPAEFHTVEGLDALKQKIGDIRDATQYGTPERVVANQLYHAVRNTIVSQAPEYARVMNGYESASNQIKDIEKTLSLNPGANVDTALRKLQSILRNNVSTNYGRRAELAEYLVNSGAPHLMEALAGQAMSSWYPRGLGRIGMQLGAEMLALGAGHAAAGPVGALTAGAMLPAMSPRLMGEAAYYAGKGARNLPIRSTARAAYQAGRADDELRKPPQR